MAEYISDAEVLQRALDTYGSTLQIVVMMEEMSELPKAAPRYLRYMLFMLPFRKSIVCSFHKKMRPVPLPVTGRTRHLPFDRLIPMSRPPMTVFC